MRRNLLVILAHGLRSDALSDARAWPLQTPNLQKLADRGLRLVANSACPSDRGGLISLLSGFAARQHGVLDPSPHAGVGEGWPDAMAEAGYHTVGVGCLTALAHGLRHSIAVQDPHTLDPDRCAYLHAMRSKMLLDAILLQRRQRQRAGLFDPDRLVIEPDDDIDGFIGGAARRALLELPEDKPWALLVGFSGPANDLPPPTLYEGLIDPRHVEAGFVPADLANLNERVELDYPRVLLQRLEPHVVGRIRADYLGRVSLIDHAVGRLNVELEQRGDRDRTWTVVCSDRGQLLGEHGLIGHRSFLGGAVETPVIVAPPLKVDPVDLPEVLCGCTDVAATIYDLAGCDPPQGVAGRSLLPLLRDPQARSGRPALLLSEFGRRIMLETARHRVVFDTQSRQALTLFDLFNDPDEQDNLALQPAGLNLLDSLRARLGEALLPLRRAG